MHNASAGFSPRVKFTSRRLGAASAAAAAALLSDAGCALYFDVTVALFVQLIQLVGAWLQCPALRFPVAAFVLFADCANTSAAAGLADNLVTVCFVMAARAGCGACRDTVSCE
jgi:hypothetical protein